MGFVVLNQPMWGGNSGFVVPDYRICTVSGYPVTLKKPLEIKKVTVYGNEGGVGDRTANMFDPSSLKQGHPSRKYESVDKYRIHAFICEVRSGEVYTVRSDAPYFGMAVYADSGNNTDVPLQEGSWNTESIYTLTITQSGYLFLYMKSSMDGKTNISPDYADSYKIMLIKGSYTGQTVPLYEPYGYKILVNIGGKCMNFYSSAALGDNNIDSTIGENHTANEKYDKLMIDVAAQTAELSTEQNIIDISHIQDWTQDFTLSEADELTVTADTAVTPSSIEIRYKGKRR